MGFTWQLLHITLSFKDASDPFRCVTREKAVFTESFKEGSLPVVENLCLQTLGLSGASEVKKQRLYSALPGFKCNKQVKSNISEYASRDSQI